MVRAAGEMSARLGRTVALICFFAAFCHGVIAQPIPVQRDPLINMLMAQPKIDLSGPVRASASFDPPIVGPGEQAFYRVTFNALEESIRMPEELKVPAGIIAKPRAHGQVLQMVSPVMVPLSVFNYRVQAGGPGRITIRSFQARAYGTNVTVPTAELQVIPTPTPIAAVPPKLIMEVAVTKLFVGQATPVTVLLPGMPGGSGTGASPIQLTGKGFIVDQGVARQMIQAIPRDGINVM